tara:strand:- start:629 stop:769 length:141 start_codon:yes stop_codon:yes gene_type:complete
VNPFTLNAALRAAGAVILMSVLEGGYELSALGRCVTAHIKVLNERE